MSSLKRQFVPPALSPARHIAYQQHYQAVPIMNPWEASALQYRLPDQPIEGQTGHTAAWQPPSSASDPVIYPGLYCPSGIDMMSILIKVMSRPNPKVNLGPIDCACALLVCDLAEPDTPIVYASEPFTQLTGYTSAEIMGKNCRFLQAPDGKVREKSSRKHVDKNTIKKMKHAVEKNEEIQLELVNFKKDGTKFVNLLTMIPIKWDGDDYRYSVGFQVDAETLN